MKVIAALSALAVFSTTVEAHSWLDCIDWDVQAQQCKGYSRNFKTQPTQRLEQDLGWDQRPGTDVPAGLVCGPKQRPNANAADGYDANYPMATLKPGQKITMRWPAKNHATVGQQRGVQLYISKAPGLGDDFSHVTSKADWIAKYPGLDSTFSNCSPNQPNVDAAECLGEYTLPTDLQPGVYTFMWWWEFNAGEFYNSCADVTVVAAAAPGTGGGDTGTPGTGGGDTGTPGTGGGDSGTPGTGGGDTGTPGSGSTGGTPSSGNDSSSSGGSNTGVIAAVGAAAVAVVGLFAYRRGKAAASNNASVQQNQNHQMINNML